MDRLERVPREYPKLLEELGEWREKVQNEPEWSDMSFHKDVAVRLNKYMEFSEFLERLVAIVKGPDEEEGRESLDYDQEHQHTEHQNLDARSQHTNLPMCRKHHFVMAYDNQTRGYFCPRCRKKDGKGRLANLFGSR
jgi:hypothetical protein